MSVRGLVVLSLLGSVAGVHVIVTRPDTSLKMIAVPDGAPGGWKALMPPPNRIADMGMLMLRFLGLRVGVPAGGTADNPVADGSASGMIEFNVTDSAVLVRDVQLTVI